LDNRPHLKAIILDFSSVNRVDLTSIQNLIDIRTVLDRYAAPRAVQWHFACIQSRWIKRAIVTAKFGYPSFGDDGLPTKWKSIFPVADSVIYDKFVVDTQHAKAEKNPAVIEDVEKIHMKALVDEDAVIVEQREHVSETQLSNRSAVYGVNRPYFHMDIDTAVKSALAYEEMIESSSEAVSSKDE
jgi:sodium-independent sulfate anion transporter 11